MEATTYKRDGSLRKAAIAEFEREKASAETIAPLCDDAPTAKTVNFDLVMDGSCAQLDILTDQGRFAHIRINNDMKLEISFTGLVELTDNGKAAEIDLLDLFKRSFDAYKGRFYSPDDLYLDFKVK